MLQSAHERTGVEAQLTVGVHESAIGRQSEEWSAFCLLEERCVHAVVCEVRLGIADDDCKPVAVRQARNVRFEVGVNEKVRVILSQARPASAGVRTSLALRGNPIDRTRSSVARFGRRVEFVRNCPGRWFSRRRSTGPTTPGTA